jgi:hypothetical protein
MKPSPVNLVSNFNSVRGIIAKAIERSTMPEGGLELSSPPSFRKLRILIAHGTHTTHKTQTLHTLGTHTFFVSEYVRSTLLQSVRGTPFASLNSRL